MIPTFHLPSVTVNTASSSPALLCLKNWAEIFTFTTFSLLDHSSQCFHVFILAVLNRSSIMLVTATICDLLIPLIYLPPMHPIPPRILLNHLPLRTRQASHCCHPQPHSNSLQATHLTLKWMKMIQSGKIYSHQVPPTTRKATPRANQDGHQNSPTVCWELPQSIQISTWSFLLILHFIQM